MEKSFSFSLSGSECKEQDEISGSEITDHNDKLELYDHADVCEPCEDMEVQ